MNLSNLFGTPRGETSHTRHSGKDAGRRAKRQGAGLHVEALEERRMLAAIIKDINTTTSDSNPAYIANLGTDALFAADDGVNGTELWKSDGTNAGTVLVKNIYTGSTVVGLVTTPNSSNPQLLTTVNGTTFFVANDGTNGSELWKTDGTPSGTVLVKDINAGATGSSIANLVNFNGTLFFTADDGSHGTELWKSDGTLAGTILVKDVKSGAGGSGATNLVVSGGRLFFTADDGVKGAELWRSDGTTLGTALVADLASNATSSNPTLLTDVNGTLYFVATNPALGTELYKSDGTSLGTVQVKDIIAGLGSSNPSKLTNVNGTLFFTASDGTNGIELWKSNGTSAGTVLVANINPTAGVGSNPAQLVNLNGTLLFRADNGTSGSELWKSDGTAVGTVQVLDIKAGASGSLPDNLTVANGVLFFTADDGVNGAELWQSDGTTIGTTLVTDLRAGAQGSAPANLAKAGSTLFFSANNGGSGVELFGQPLPNARPINGNDAYVFDTGTPLTITTPGVLANDSDPEGAAITAALVTGPASGSVVLNANGSFTYTPLAGFNGQVSFTYVANDGTLNALNAATVTLTGRDYRFVQHLYTSVLGRSAASVTAGEITYWTGVIAGGATRADVTAAFLASDEYRANLVNGFYQTYLGRSAEASALTFWVVAMRAGVTSSNVQAAILGSDEYVRLHGGNTGFVSSLYTDLLGRAGSSTEIGFWGDALLAGTYSTASIAQAFVNSTEYRVRLIAGLYTSLLGRPVDAAGQTFWLTQLNAGQQREAIIQGIVSSAEFYAL